MDNQYWVVDYLDLPGPKFFGITCESPGIPTFDFFYHVSSYHAWRRHQQRSVVGEEGLLGLYVFIMTETSSLSNILKFSQYSDSVLWQEPLNQQKCQKPEKGKSDNTNNGTKKFDYTAVDPLWTDLGWSVGATATQLKWLTWFTGPTFPLPATAV